MNRPVVRAAALDAASIVVFVAIGRRSHDEDGNAVVGVLQVAAPFVIALLVAWLAARGVAAIQTTRGRASRSG